MRRLALSAALAAVVSATAAAARAAAPPVGPLPPGPTATVATSAGELVAVALPQRSGGRVWRIARSLNASVLHDGRRRLQETHRGDATISFGLTQGETRTALESRTYKVHVR